jgi:predicted SnoaL-like aldol condensation-catalyzing enzyme
MQRDKMEAAISTIYDKIFNEGQGQLLPGLVSGPYIQHNPQFPDGTDFIVRFIMQAKKVPCEVKRVAIDGDLAFVHVRYLNWGGRETAGVDIFRFDADGKIVEHWDVLQPVPDTASNANGMF